MDSHIKPHLDTYPQNIRTILHQELGYNLADIVLVERLDGTLRSQVIEDGNKILIARKVAGAKPEYAVLPQSPEQICEALDLAVGQILDKYLDNASTKSEFCSAYRADSEHFERMPAAQRLMVSKSFTHCESEDVGRAHLFAELCMHALAHDGRAHRISEAKHYPLTVAWFNEHVAQRLKLDPLVEVPYDNEGHTVQRLGKPPGTQAPQLNAG